MSNQQDTKKKNPNVPNLRFSSKLSYETFRYEDICKISTGSFNTQDKEDGGIYPFFVRSQTVERINKFNHEGIAILTAGDGVGVGKVFHFVEGKIGVHQRVYILDRFERVDPKYIYYHFSSRFYDRVKRMSAKNSVDSIRREMIANMILHAPEDAGEMGKIVSFFNMIDERIIVQNKIIETYLSLINPLFDRLHKGLLAKPIRLIDVAVIKKGEQINGDMMDDSDDYPMLNGGIAPSGCFSRPNRPKDTIAISEGGNSCGYVSFMTTPFWAGGHCYTVHPVENGIVSNKYLFYALKNQEKKIMRLRVGSGLPNIQKSDLSNFSINIPTKESQGTIVQTLDCVTSKLKTEQQYLALLNQLKAFLLANMFI